MNKTALINKIKLKWLSKSFECHIKFFVVIKTKENYIFTNFSGFIFQRNLGTHVEADHI
jgi:hypothetical protein